MPTWPTNKPNSNRFNSDSDSIKQSRTELKTMSDAVNDIVDFIDTTGIGAGKVLVYNASTSRLEVGENLLNISAGTNITIDQDSAGGITINATGGLSNPLTANLETNEFTIGHLQGDDSAGGESTAMRFTDNGEIHLFTSSKFSGGLGGGATEVKLANAKFDRFYNAIPPGPGPAGDNTNYGPIALFSQDLNSDDSAGTSGSAKVGVLNNGDGILLTTSKTDGSTTFNGTIKLNQRDGILLENGSSQFDSAGENESAIRFKTTHGNIILEPNQTIRLKYSNWPGNDGSNHQVLETNGSGLMLWQNNFKYQTMNGDSGSTTASAHDDTFTITGGTDISTSVTGDTVTINYTGSASLTIQDEGSPLSTSANTINFVGAGVTATGTGATKTITIPGGGAGDEVAAGDNISISQPDSTGTKSISFRSPFNQPVDAGDQQLSNLSIKNYGEIVYTSGSTTGTITPDPNNGSVQKITLTGSITLNSLSNVASGDSLTLIVKQPSSGGPYTLSSTMKFSGANKTLSTGANEIDIITIFYDGTDYLASLSTNFN